MGTKLKEIIERKSTSFKELAGKIVVVDSFNILYQFLSSIRQADGTPLMDMEGNITSHLNGLFFRTAKMLEHDIRPVFVFDGKAHDLKREEKQRRVESKEKARKQYDVAKRREDVEAMKKFASRTSHLSSEMVSEAKQLLTAMGLPVVQAPSEGEAQAAYMVNEGDAFAGVSQDYDCLLYGVKKVIQNLAVSEKRKKPGALGYVKVSPQIVDLEENKKRLGINQEQLIILGILVGTDYNYGGIKGIGPKTALKLVKEHKDNYEELFKEVKWKENFNIDWKEIFDIIKKAPVTDDYKIEFKALDEGKVKDLLVERYGFSEARVDSALSRLKQRVKETAQKGLGGWMR